MALLALFKRGLLTDTESCDNRTVSLNIYLFEVTEKASSLTDHHQKTASAVMILLVDLEVLGEVVDSLCEKSDLYLGRTCVTLMGSVFGHDSLLFFFKHLIFPPLHFICLHLSKGL